MRTTQRGTNRIPQRTGYNLDAVEHMQAALSLCVGLGAHDEVRGIPDATGDELIEWIGPKAWRVGHKRYLRSAYAAGRFCAQMRGAK